MMKKYLSIFISISVFLTLTLATAVVYADYSKNVTETREVVAKADATNKVNGCIKCTYKNEYWYYNEEDTDYDYDYDYDYETLYYPEKIKLSEEEYVYDGSSKTPSVTVYDYYENVVDPSNYVVSYYNNVNCGSATVTVDFIGDYYTGSISQSFIIRPKAVTVTAVKYKSKGKINVSWKKQGSASGYLIQYSTSKAFINDGRTCTVLVSGGNKASKEIGGLANKTYYVRIFAYKDVDSIKYAGVDGNVKSVKVKKGVSLKEMINYTKTDMTGRKEIKKLTNNAVDIKKYKTTYDRMKAIYKWHAKNNTKFVHCLACNANYNECILALYGKQRCYDNCVWIGAGNFINSNGSKSMHKWSIIYISGVPYIFDPRIQGYGNKSGFDYFGVQTSSKQAKKRYQFEGWYFYQIGSYGYDIM